MIYFTPARIFSHLWSLVAFVRIHSDTTLNSKSNSSRTASVMCLFVWGWVGVFKKMPSGKMAIAPLWKALRAKVCGFWKIQEVIFLMGTRIFQIGLLGSEKIEHFLRELRELREFALLRLLSEPKSNMTVNHLNVHKTSWRLPFPSFLVTGPLRSFSIYLILDDFHFTCQNNLKSRMSDSDFLPSWGVSNSDQRNADWLT